MAAIAEMRKRYTDLSFIRENSFNNERFVVEMLELFIATTPALLTELRQYLNNQEWTQLGQVAHKLKAQVHTFGMEEASNYLGEIEQNINRSMHPAVLTSLVEKIEAMCLIALEELVQDLQSLKGQ
jgi:HPt (histidine-containing phosphotransfer) domain-containing protein